MRSAHCWGSAGRRWLRRMTGCTPVHGNIQNAAAKAWRASSELGTDKIVTKSGALGCQPDKHGTMILTRSDTSVQLTYTLEEYKEFNHAIVAFRNEITRT